MRAWPRMSASVLGTSNYVRRNTPYLELETKGGEESGGGYVSKGVNPACADCSYRKTEETWQYPCMQQNQVQEIGQVHRHRLGWRERGEMYCAPLMVEGFELEDPAKVRGKITMESWYRVKEWEEAGLVPSLDTQSSAMIKIRARPAVE